MRHFGPLLSRLLAMGLVVTVAAAPAYGDPSEPAQRSEWLTGAALEKQLDTPVSVAWTNTPAARALRSLSAAQHVAVVLDRRLDPDQSISLTLGREPLADGLRKIADQLQAGYCQLGPVAYLGPYDVAQRLRTLAALRLEDVKSLPKPRLRKFLELRVAHWEELAEPRPLLTALAAEAGVKLVGVEKIPHDLWPATDLPPMTWLDRMTLLAAQFGLTFCVEDEGQRVELVSMPAKVTLVRTYQAPRQADLLAKRWAKALPTARVTARENTVRVDGRLEDHEYVERRLHAAPTKRTTVAPGKEAYQLSVENAALSQVVQELASRLSLNVQWDRATIERAGISINQLITVKIKDASLDDLLRAVLKDTKLAFRRDEKSVSIYPAKSPPAAP